MGKNKITVSRIPRSSRLCCINSIIGGDRSAPVSRETFYARQLLIHLARARPLSRSKRSGPPVQITHLTPTAGSCHLAQRKYHLPKKWCPCPSLSLKMHPARPEAHTLKVFVGLETKRYLRATH